MHGEIEEFLESHRGAVKEKTYQAYKRNLEQFSEWLEDDRIHPHEVSKRDLKRYITYLKRKKGYASKTVRSKYAAVQLYYYDEYSEGNIEQNPTKRLKRGDVAEDKTMKHEKTHEERVFLTESEIQRLINHAPSPQLRNRLVILFQYQTGLRRQEVVNVELANLDRDARIVKVRGKHDKEITAYYQASLDPLLDQWIDGRYRKGTGKAENSDYLFLTNSTEQLSANQLNKIVRQAAKSAGLQEELYQDAQGNWRHKVTSHVLRHSFAAHWIKRGGSTSALQNIFAHTDPQTTETYKDMLDEWVMEEAQSVRVGEGIKINSDMHKDECEICTQEGLLSSHHTSYNPPEVMQVCNQCHISIHHKEEYSELLPDMSRREAKDQGYLD